MYAPLSDDDRPSVRRHSIKARKDSVGSDSIRKGVAGAVPRRRSSATASRNSVLKVKVKVKVKREKSPHIDNASKPVGVFDHLATYMVERQISEYRLVTISMFSKILSRAYALHLCCRIFHCHAFLLRCCPPPTSTVSIHDDEAV